MSLRYAAVTFHVFHNRMLIDIAGNPFECKFMLLILIHELIIFIFIFPNVEYWHAILPHPVPDAVCCIANRDAIIIRAATHSRHYQSFIYCSICSKSRFIPLVFYLPPFL